MTVKSADVVKQIEEYLQVLNNSLGFEGECENEEDFLDSPKRRTLADIKAVHVVLKFHIKYRPKYRTNSSTSPFVTEDLCSSGMCEYLYSQRI